MKGGSLKTESRIDPEEKGLRRFAMGSNKRLTQINNEVSIVKIAFERQIYRIDRQQRKNQDLERHNRTKFLVEKHRLELEEQRRQEQSVKLHTFWKRKATEEVKPYDPEPVEEVRAIEDSNNEEDHRLLAAAQASALQSIKRPYSAGVVRQYSGLSSVSSSNRRPASGVSRVSGGVITTVGARPASASTQASAKKSSSMLSVEPVPDEDGGRVENVQNEKEQARVERLAFLAQARFDAFRIGEW